MDAESAYLGFRLAMLFHGMMEGELKTQDQWWALLQKAANGEYKGFSLDPNRKEPKPLKEIAQAVLQGGQSS